MEPLDQNKRKHSGQTAVAIICIFISLFYFVIAKATGINFAWGSICAAASAIPAILFLTRYRNDMLLRAAKLFSFPVAIAILMIANIWMKMLEG